MEAPLYIQFCEGIRTAILEGRLARNTLLPSPRVLAKRYACSRHTVATAYEHLVAEGLLIGLHGVGTYVADKSVKPIHNSSARIAPLAGDVRSPAVFPAQIGQVKLGRNESEMLQLVGASDFKLFPHENWAKLYYEYWKNPPESVFDAPNLRGDPCLRGEISKLIARTRGISAAPENILITNGTTQSIDLLLRTLLAPGDRVAIECPGRPKLAALLAALGLECVTFSLDRDGVKITEEQLVRQNVRAIIVTPTNHYPTGCSMSKPRRRHLLDLCEKHHIFLVEDDYDGDLVSVDDEVLSLYSMKPSMVSVYLATFSKSISPLLRIGYMIADESIIEKIVKFKYISDYYSSYFHQPVLAKFLESGVYDIHIRKVKKAYSDRNNAFMEEMINNDLISELPNRSSSLFSAFRNRSGASDGANRSISQQARSVGIPSLAICDLSISGMTQDGVAFGTSRLALESIPKLVSNLASSLKKCGIASPTFVPYYH